MPGNFKDGNVIILKSLNSGKSLRIMPDGCVNGSGGEGSEGMEGVWGGRLGAGSGVGLGLGLPS